MTQQAPATNDQQKLSHALVFADVDDFEDVGKGLIGPLFFTSEHAAFVRFATYLHAYVISNQSVRNTCIGALAKLGIEVEANLSLEAIQKLTSDELEVLCDAFVRERASGEGRQTFYVVRPIQ